jgi:hypothetical protein
MPGKILPAFSKWPVTISLGHNEIANSGAGVIVGYGNENTREKAESLKNALSTAGIASRVMHITNSDTILIFISTKE